MRDDAQARSRHCPAQIGLVVALFVLFFCAPGQGASADPGETAPPSPRLVASGEALLSPVIAVDRNGVASVAWVQRKRAAGEDAVGEDAQGEAEIRLAQAPDWTSIRVAGTSSEGAGAIRLLLAAGAETHLAWADPTFMPATVWRYTHEAMAAPEPWEGGVPYAALAADQEGGLQALWANESGLVLADAGTALTSSLALDMAVSPADLDLALDVSGRPHASWAGRKQAGEEADVYYVALATDAAPTLVDAGGRAPHLAVGPQGRAQLCWLRPEGLFCADSRDWGRAWLTVPNLASDRVALAVGPGEVAHLAWAEGGALWYANSSDWNVSRRRLVDLDAAALSMAVDTAGRPHIAVTVPSEGGESDLYVLEPFSPAPQLDVVFPAEGAWLAQGDILSAVANLPATEWQRMTFYLRPEGGEDALIPVGSDYDGRDGWSVVLDAAPRDATAPHRVVVVGVDVHGGVTSAVGAPLAVQPAGEGDVWVLNPGPRVVHGEGEVRVMVPGAGEDLERIVVSLTAPGCPPNPAPGEAACSIAPRTFLVASVIVDSSRTRPDGDWLPIAYDSRAVPDGNYRVSAIAIDRDGGERAGVSAQEIVVDNTLAPAVRITAPDAGAVVSGRFVVAAEASSPFGRVQRVEFFAERGRPLFERGIGLNARTVTVPETVWLGSDADGEDGWSVQVVGSPSLDGDAWMVRALAYDSFGRATAARSEGEFTVVARDRPVARLEQPAPGGTVRDVAAVTVDVVAGNAQVRAITLYARTSGGRLTSLGPLEGRGRQWTGTWDTTRLSDGDYELVALANLRNGRLSLVAGGVVRVANREGTGAFIAPEPGAVIDGAVVLRLQGGDASDVQVHYRDAEGQLRAVGTAAAAGGDWTLAWDTAGVLDGTYVLVATMRGAGGSVTRVEREVQVLHDGGPALIAFPSEGEVVRGVRPLAWETGGDARLTLDLSLDGGAHWVTLAGDLAPSDVLDWDSTLQPDTPYALLRLTALGGTRPATATSPVFTIDNANEPPRVALLAPTDGEVLGAPVTIAWRAWDPDGGAVVADLDYRRGQGAWQPLASDLMGTESFTWDTTDLAPAADYRVRVSVRDADGAAVTAEVSDISLLANRPPVVHLVSPNERAELRGDSVILWQAEDPDGDPLFVDLFYSDDAGQTWLPLAEGIPNTGYYVWQVSFLPMGAGYRVRVVARDGFYQARDESDGVFVVGGALPPTVTLLEPAAGSRVAGLVLMRWDVDVAATDEFSATVEVRPANGAAWRNLAREMVDDGLYAWDTTALPDGAYELRVILGNEEGVASTSAIIQVTIANGRNGRPGVILLTPTGGEVWRGTHEIRWRAWDDDGDPLTASIAASADGGRTWEELAAVDAGRRSILWDTSDLRGARGMLVRVSVNDGQVWSQDTTSAPVYLVNEAHVPELRFRSPDANGSLWRGNVVAWDVGMPGDAESRVSLALSRDDGASWQTVADARYDAGEAVVPDDLLKPGRTYRLRLIADSGAFRVRRVSAPFEVAIGGSEPPAMTLEQPSGGEVWSGTQEVRWSARPADGRALRVTLEVSSDDGLTWLELARDPAGEIYPWDTTTVANGVYRLRITAGDERSESVLVSPRFIVENPGRSTPAISLIAPRADVVWTGTREIRWRADDRDGGALVATLAYSLDGGGTWRRFAYNVPASEGYIWDTTTAPNCDAVWLRATLSDGVLSSDDYAGPFAIRNPRGPIVALLDPVGGERWSGEQRIVWHAVQEPGRVAKTMLQFSADRGRTWQTIAHDLPAQGSYTWDTTAVPDYAAVLVRAYVSDGQQSAVATTLRPLRVRRTAGAAAPSFYRP